MCQDWGGLLGLTLPMDMPERFARLLVMNTGIAVGRPVSDGFAAWKAFAASYHDIPVAGLIALSSPGALNPYDAAAYDAPFPDASYKAGVRRFPQLVAVEPGMEGVAYGERARAFLANDWRGESFMAIGLRDPVLGKPVMEELRAHDPRLPACARAARGRSLRAGVGRAGRAQRSRPSASRMEGVVKRLGLVAPRARAGWPSPPGRRCPRC